MSISDIGFASKRLRFREPCAADASLLHSLDNDAEVMRWINGGEQIGFDVFCRDQMPVYIKRESVPLFGFWLIETDDEFVGWVSLRRADAAGIASLGYRLRQVFWGQGMATEAAAAMLGHACATINARELTGFIANTYEENLGSQRVLEKLGFSLVRKEQPTPDTLANHDTSLATNEVWDGDEFYYALERSEFVSA